jgi:chromosome segregation ATPase
LTATGRDLDFVQEGFRSIIRLLGEFDDLSDDIKLSFLSGDEQKKIQDATKALSDYGKAMEEIAKKQKLLDAEQKTNAKDKTTLDKAKKKVSGLQDEKALTQARLSGAQTKLKAAKGMENANPKDIAKYEAEVEKLTAELTILDKNLGAANEELTTA